MTNTNITPDTRFLMETLVTDTRCYEIVSRTAKTLTIRPMLRGGLDSQYRDGGPWPVNTDFALVNPNAETFVVRLRKDGTYRTGNGMNPLYGTDKPRFITDYRF